MQSHVPLKPHLHRLNRRSPSLLSRRMIHHKDNDEETTPFIHVQHQDVHSSTLTQPPNRMISKPYVKLQQNTGHTHGLGRVLSPSPEPPPAPELRHQYIRYFFLVALCVQNCSYTLLRRFSTGILMEKVSDSSILIGGELIKLIVSLFMTFVGPDVGLNIGTMPMPEGKAAHFRKIMMTSFKMAVPAFVYYCMNRLSFVALRRIDAGTFTVVAQLKTLTTAAFSYLILNRRFSAVRVRSLIHLVCSVIVISEFAATHSGPTHSADDVALSAFILGLIAVATEVTLSGLISVYYQKVLQDDKRNLSAWDRNIQLATFSIILYFPTFHGDGYFEGWSFITLIVSVLGATGGLLVAFSMKYTDAILKALATSGAIVLTSVLSWYWLNGPYGIPIAVSSISVVVAIFSYVTNGKMPWSSC